MNFSRFIAVPKFRQLCVLFIPFLFTFEASSDNAKPIDQVIVSSRTDWPPYSYLNKNGELLGSDIAILKATLNRMNASFDYVTGIPAKRLEKSNHKLGFNTVLAATYNDKRSKTHYFSKPYRDENVMVYVSNPKYTKYESIEQLLRNGLVGAINRSAFYGDKFEKLKLALPDSLLHIDTSHRRLELLQTERVDFVINDAGHMDYLAKTSNNSTQVIASFILQRQNVSFMFLKTDFSANFVKDFNAALTLVLNE